MNNSWLFLYEFYNLLPKVLWYVLSPESFIWNHIIFLSSCLLYINPRLSIASSLFNTSKFVFLFTLAALRKLLFFYLENSHPLLSFHMMVFLNWLHALFNFYPETTLLYFYMILIQCLRHHMSIVHLKHFHSNFSQQCENHKTDRIPCLKYEYQISLPLITYKILKMFDFPTFFIFTLSKIGIKIML